MIEADSNIISAIIQSIFGVISSIAIALLTYYIRKNSAKTKNKVKHFTLIKEQFFDFLKDITPQYQISISQFEIAANEIESIYLLAHKDPFLLPPSIITKIDDCMKTLQIGKDIPLPSWTNKQKNTFIEEYKKTRYEISLLENEARDVLGYPKNGFYEFLKYKTDIPIITIFMIILIAVSLMYILSILAIYKMAFALGVLLAIFVIGFFLFWGIRFKWQKHRQNKYVSSFEKNKNQTQNTSNNNCNKSNN